MKLGAMQPYFFPYLGYFQLVAAVDKFLLYDNLNYIQKGWVHRNRIRLKGQGEFYCSVPLVHPSSFVKIKDVQVDRSRRWPAKFLDLLAFNYKKAPFFEEVFALVQTIVNHDTSRLTEVNCRGIMAIAGYLEIAAHITCDSAPYQEFETAVEDGDRSGLMRALSAQTGVTDVKVLRILYLCRMEHANHYINAIGGQALYPREVFARNGVRLDFLQTRFTPYPQQEDTFIPGLSILDVLMHCGREGTRRLLHDFDLV